MECESTRLCNWAYCDIDDPDYEWLGFTGQCTEGALVPRYIEFQAFTPQNIASISRMLVAKTSVDSVSRMARAVMTLDLLLHVSCTIGIT